MESLEFTEKDEDGYTVINPEQVKAQDSVINEVKQESGDRHRLEIQPVSPNSVLRNRGIDLPNKAVTLELVSKKFVPPQKRETYWSILFPSKKAADANAAVQDTEVTILDSGNDEFRHQEAKPRDCCTWLKQKFSF